MKNLPDINKIASDGFALSERKDFSYALSDKKEMQDSIVLLSLRMALRSYFSTYHTMKAHIRAMEGKVIGVIDPQGYMDYLHFRDYWEAYAETVIHFHHFIELALKDLLRAEHPLLAIDPSAKPVILHRLLQRESLTLMEQEGLRSIEFAEALRRVCELIQAGRIDNHEKLDFIAKARVLLETLNSLRNRTIHRGSFILRYRALDNLIGGYVLPLVKQIMELPQYADAHKAWKYSELECKVDPLEEIVKEFEGGNYNLGKIAFLKELGRAAYQNPLSSGPVRRQREKKEIVILGQTEYPSR